MNHKYLELWFDDGDRAFFYNSEVSIDRDNCDFLFFSTYNDKGHLVLEDMPLIIASSGDRETLKGDTAFDKIMTNKIVCAVIAGNEDMVNNIEINENTGGMFFVDLLGDLHFRLYKKSREEELVT